MKKIISILLLVLIFANCFNEPKPKNDQTNIALALLLLSRVCGGNSGKFYLYNYNTGNYDCVGAELKYSRAGVDVYAQAGLEFTQSLYGLSKINYKSIGDNFVDKIQKNLEPMIGKPSDVNKDNKVTIFFFDLLSSSSSGSFVAGFIDPVHFFQSGELLSNEREIMYINGLELVALNLDNVKRNRPDSILSTIAHEYQHLVRFQHEFKRPGMTSPIPLPTTQAELDSLTSFDETWINEGTSELASDVSGYGPQYERAACFRGDPTYSCDGGFNGKSILNWQSSLLNYSSSYLFIKYLYEISGSSTTEKQNFINRTIIGSNSIRANTSSNLMQLFRSNSTYNSTLLSTDNTTIFQRLYGLFLSRALGYELNATPANDSSIQIGNNASTPLFSLGNAYPLSSELTTLFSFPTNIAKLNASQVESLGFQVFRIGNLRAAGTYDANAVYVKRGTNGAADPLDALIFNGTLNKDSFVTTKSSHSQTKNTIISETNELDLRKKLTDKLRSFIN
ncbi:MAG: hypothetical protein SFU98_06770 [Leptospiraceae bacterium]|nr:hypothetical protein [Leptospiraceae bacterium]